MLGDNNTKSFSKPELNLLELNYLCNVLICIALASKDVEIGKKLVSNPNEASYNLFSIK